MLGFKDSDAEIEAFYNGDDLLSAFSKNQAKYPKKPSAEMSEMVKSLGAKAFQKLVVPGSEAAELKALLKKRNVSSSTVYPGFDGVVREVLP